MPKIKTPSTLSELVRTTGVGTKLKELTELEDRVIPVFLVNPVPQYQADKSLSQDNPVSGQLYTLLETTPNVRLIDVIIIVTWTEQPTPLEVRVTIDGRIVVFAVSNPVSGTPYTPGALSGTSDWGFLSTTYSFTMKPFIFEGRSIKVEVETTGGTVSNLTARLKWAKW